MDRIVRDRVHETAEMVGEYFGVSKDDILGPSRKKEIARARKFVYYFAYEVTGYGFPTVARALRRKSHDTVWEGHRDVSFWYNTYSGVKKIVEEIYQLVEPVKKVDLPPMFQKANG
jgi:chromosomal replication initiator protein